MSKFARHLYGKLPYIFSASESAFQQEEEALWRSMWPPIYTQQLSNGPLIVMRGRGTEDTCLHQPPRSNKWPAKPVPLEEAVWQHQVGYWRPEPVKWKIRRHRGGLGKQCIGSEEVSFTRPSRDPRETDLVAQLCTIPWVRGDWPPQQGRSTGWPLESMFVG